MVVMVVVSEGVVMGGVCGGGGLCDARVRRLHAGGMCGMRRGVCGGERIVGERREMGGER